MIRLQNKTNVDAPTSDYPFGKIRDDVSGTPGTPVDEQLYGDVHQFLEKMFEESGHSANNLPDNQTNNFQLFEALLAIIAKGAPGVVEGAWIAAGAPTLTPDTGTVTSFSTLYNRYKITGKTFHWQYRGVVRVDTGTPSMIRVSYPTSVSQAGYNSAGPHKVIGYYRTAQLLLCELHPSGLEMRLYPSGTFAPPENFFGFDVVLELV